MEEEEAPLDDWRYIATARFFKQHECLDYLREKGSREPSDEEYAQYAKAFRERKTSQQLSGE